MGDTPGGCAGEDLEGCARGKRKVFQPQRFVVLLRFESGSCS